MKIKLKVKGGPGSGNYGHAGIPGHVGGSTSGSIDTTTREPTEGVWTHTTSTEAAESIRRGGFSGTETGGIIWMAREPFHKGKDVITVKLNASPREVTDLFPEQLLNLTPIQYANMKLDSSFIEALRERGRKALHLRGSSRDQDLLLVLDSSILEIL